MIYEFQATQSFNGYDKPWAPGANINVFGDYTEINAFLSGTTITSGSTNRAAIIKINPETSYVIRAIRTPLSTGSDSCLIAFFEGDTIPTIGDSAIAGSVKSNVYGAENNTVTITGTSPENAQWMFIKYAVITATEAEATIKTIQVQEGSSITDYYSPYENDCPPEGFNIWDPDQQDYTQVYAGYVNANTRELYLRPVYKEYAGEELVGPWMSSLDPYAEDTTPTTGAFVIDFGGELTSFEITPFMLQTLLDSLGIRQHFTDGAGLLNSLMDQAQGRVRSEEELLHLSRPLKVIAIGDQLPAGLTFKPISKDVLPGLPGKFIR